MSESADVPAQAATAAEAAEQEAEENAPRLQAAVTADLEELVAELDEEEALGT